jgi:hypothetical protein
MEELTLATKDFISTLDGQVDNELKVVEYSDWSKEGTLKKRKDLHDLHFLFTQRAVGNAVTLYKIGKADVSHPEFKEMIRKLIKFFDIYSKRYEYYRKEYDVSKFLDEDKDISDYIEEIEGESTFQADLMKNVNKFREDLRSINFGGEGDTVTLILYDNKLAPFLMKEAILKRFPEVEKVYNKKIEDVKTETVKDKAKSPRVSKK